MLLRIEKLHKSYGGVHALDSVSMTLAAAEVLGLVGDNGAGKSTLLKCITGAEAQDLGEIYFADRVLMRGNPHASRAAGIEMIYQELNLCLQQDAVANIFLGRELCRTIGGRVLPWLDLKAMRIAAQSLMARLNIEIDLRRPVGELSGGQQQAVAIARSLISSPKLLIMDEPTAALGLKEVAKVLDLIGALKEQGISIILVSHRLTDIFAVADRVVLLRHGRLADEGLITDLTLEELTRKIVG